MLDPEIKVQLTPSQKAELGDPLAAALRFRICTFEIDGDAENRSGAFVVLPRPCRLSPNCKTESR